MDKLTENFTDLHINETLVEKLNVLSITKPTAVQKKVIPMIADNKNIMFQSETGTGKTFAYLLPLIQKIQELNENQKNNEVELIIAAPTYELASQIKIQTQLVTDFKTVLCIGGSPLSRQIEMLKEKPKIVIGGPARLMELIHLKKLKTGSVKALVLDEADRLLSPELCDETEALLERLQSEVQLIGCSATVSEYTRKTLQNARKTDENQSSVLPLELVTLPPEDVLRKRITHWAIFAEKRNKIDTLRSFINAEKPEKLIVFSARTDQIEIIASKLKYKKIDCEALCARTDKKIRKTIIDRFKSGKCRILITTDLSSRGLDIPGITHVIQMDLPESSDFFIHRAGRTARSGSKGINCVIGDEFEMKKFAALEKKLKITVYPKCLYKGKIVSPEEFK